LIPSFFFIPDYDPAKSHFRAALGFTNVLYLVCSVKVNKLTEEGKHMHVIVNLGKQSENEPITVFPGIFYGEKRDNNYRPLYV
jgi:hypothetical protein